MHYYGGQAVIEGVMIRGQREVAVAVRDPSGRIIIHRETLNALIYRHRWATLPFLRGLILLWDMLILGIRALIFSASVATGQEREELSPRAVWGTLALSLTAAVGLFFLAPLFLVGAVDRHLSSPLLINLLEGLIRLSIMVGYIVAIGRWPDIQRVFAYHGAEHKAINAYEDGASLEPAVVARYSTAHPRCGTAFLLVVVLVAILVFALLGHPPLGWRILSRIVLLPLIVAVAYELLRLGAAHRHPLVHLLRAPSLALQALTTREPSLDQIEVALAALRGALAADEALAAPLPNT